MYAIVFPVSLVLLFYYFLNIGTVTLVNNVRVKPQDIDCCQPKKGHCHFGTQSPMHCGDVPWAWSFFLATKNKGQTKMPRGQHRSAEAQPIINR